MPLPAVESISLAANAFVVLELVVRVGLALRIILRRLPTGVTLSWLLLVLAVPFLGAALYLMIGESRMGRRRAILEGLIQPHYDAYLNVHGTRDGEAQLGIAERSRPVFDHARAITRFPALGGNRMDLIDDAQDVLHRILADIDKAERSVHMAFYIWSTGGTADDVAQAVIRAAKRGVSCRVAVDAIGGGGFLKSPLAAELRAAGVALITVLPVGLLRTFLVRSDHRNHRKIIIIDGELAYTGSMNLVDPRFFKQEGTDVGQWVDAMLRVQGPIVESLQILFLHDWALETANHLDQPDTLACLEDADLVGSVSQGGTIAQLVPSGPGRRYGTVHSVLIGLIYGAREEIVLTTPYFVPDVTLQNALIAAGHRGVAVHLVVPHTVDSRLVHYASRAFFGELLDAGVEIHRYAAGLLHTKSITVDGRTALFGTLNLDPRSFWLNFELMLLLEDEELVGRLRALQGEYIEDAEPIDAAAWTARPNRERLVENALQIFAPLL